MATRTATPRRRKKKEIEPTGLEPQETKAEPPPAIQSLIAQVEADGGTVLAPYRDPFGGRWVLLVTLPIARVEPSPFQRKASDLHVGRLRTVVEKVGRFLDPIIVVRQSDGIYWTPNGNHRLQAVRALGGRSVTGLLLPEAEMVYTILALNTEKAHNLREKALEVIGMARELGRANAGVEAQYALAFEDPSFLTLGIAYEERPRFSGGAYHPVVRRVDEFLTLEIGAAIARRTVWARKLLALDDRVAEIITELRARNFQSPYLRNFIVARLNPLRFQRGKTSADLPGTLEKMQQSADKFDTAKVRPQDLASAGGPPPTEE
jgi:ParB family transcriptional regulator, chromosome partitioning protein